MWWTKEIKTPARLFHIFLVASDLLKIKGCLKLVKFYLSFHSLKVWMGFFNYFMQFE